MLNYRLGTVNDFHWEFKPVLSYSKRIAVADVWISLNIVCDFIQDCVFNF